MTVLHRIHAFLEDTNQAILNMKRAPDKASVAEQDAALQTKSGQAFYSSFTPRDARTCSSRQKLNDEIRRWMTGTVFAIGHGTESHVRKRPEPRSYDQVQYTEQQTEIEGEPR